MTKKSSPNLLLCTLFLVAMMLSSLIYTYEANAADDYHDKQFRWSYGDYDWTFNMSIPKTLYNAYKDVRIRDRLRGGPENYGYLTTTKDQFIIHLAKELNKTAAEEGYSAYETVSFILAFIQSLPYTSDSSSAAYDEYPRFPIETLVDDGGDCEDTSILFATFVLILEYGAIYINPPDHVAVGVLGEDTVPGSYWTYNNKRYYYCETTGDGFEIGQLPEDVEGKSAYLFPIDVSKQFVPRLTWVTSSPTPSFTPTASVPELSTWTVTPLILAAAVLLLVRRKKDRVKA